MVIFSSFALTAQKTDSSKAKNKTLKRPIMKKAIVTEVTPALSYETIEVKEQKPDTGKVIVGLQETKDDRIDLLIQDYIENKKNYGYRIQIFSSSNNKWEAVKARSEFLKKYPESKSYLIYQAPNFKVRIGNFPDRLAATENLELIKEEFPTAFIVQDEIEPEVE